MSILQKIYVESTVWYQLVNFSSSDFKIRAMEFMESLKREKFTLFISNLVLEELMYNKDPYRKRLEYLFGEIKPVVLMCSSEAEDLASAYLENAFIGKEKSDVIIDAYHAAIATASNISYIVTYNFRNLLNVKILEHINAINMLAGYNHHLMALPPFMFLELTDFEGERGTVDSSIWKIKSRFGKKLTTFQGNGGLSKLEQTNSLTEKMAESFKLELVRFSESNLRLI